MSNLLRSNNIRSLLSIAIAAALLVGGMIIASSQMLSSNTAKAFTKLFQNPGVNLPGVHNVGQPSGEGTTLISILFYGII
jgi:hypothetical protein